MPDSWHVDNKLDKNCQKPAGVCLSMQLAVVQCKPQYETTVDCELYLTHKPVLPAVQKVKTDCLSSNAKGMKNSEACRWCKAKYNSHSVLCA